MKEPLEMVDDLAAKARLDEPGSFRDIGPDVLDRISRTQSDFSTPLTFFALASFAGSIITAGLLIETFLGFTNPLTTLLIANRDLFF